MTARRVVFVCPHGAAKSVIAAAYCQRLAADLGLSVQTLALGTEPDAVVSPAVVAALSARGIDVSEHLPRLATDGDLVDAWRIVSLGCDLDDLLPVGRMVERWDDVPATSEDMPAAIDRITKHVDQLVDALQHEAADTTGA